MKAAVFRSRLGQTPVGSVRCNRRNSARDRAAVPCYPARSVAERDRPGFLGVIFASDVSNFRVCRTLSFERQVREESINLERGVDMSLCAYVTSESLHRGRYAVMAPTPLFVLPELPTRPEPQPKTVRSFKDELLAATPSLRAFALSMVGCWDRADDLVHDTLLKAWANSDRFKPGTNLRGWLFTILRNTYYSQHWKSQRKIEDVDGAMAQRLSTPASQDDHVKLEDFKIALSRIPLVQREALILVGGAGFSYDEAAAICGCLVGTIKSRVSRARSALAEMLGVEPRGLSEGGAPIG